MTFSRRDFLGASAIAAANLLVRGRRQDAPLPPIRTITRGPRHHWFGYYDKLQFDVTGRYVLGMKVNFEHRTPTADDEIGIGMVDLEDGDRWIELGRSRAWCWQQGCMLQWRPGSDTEVIWNDRSGDQFVCRVLDVQSREERKIPSAVYALHPQGQVAVSVDFGRLQDCRPGYGYRGVPDANAAIGAPADSGLFRVDLETGERTLILSLRDVLDVGEFPADQRDGKHWFNHLLFSPDGARFIFLHRWQPKGQRGWHTRMLTAAPDGSAAYVVDPSGFTSHFIWRDPQHILAWTRPAGRPDGFYLFTDRADEVQAVGTGIMTQNGHCTYLPGNKWILNDTYADREHLQHPYLFHVASGRRVALGHFESPPEYRGEWRCDLHPRFSRDGTRVVIDSPHGGAGRQMHLIDVTGIVTP